MRHAVPRAVGSAHASTVMALVRSSELESGIVTQSFVPSKDRAAPNFPIVQVGPALVPLLELPEESAMLVPVPSSNP